MLNSLFKTLTRYKVLAKFMSSSLLGVPISLLTGFIAFRTIDPYYMGVWTTVLVFENYINILRLGIVNGLNRELPYSIGSGEDAKALLYVRTTFSYTIFNIIIILLCAPFIYLFIGHNTEYYVVLSAFFLRVILDFYSTFLTGTLRSNHDFNKLSNIQFIMIVLKLILVPLFFLGFYGFVIMQVLLISLNTLLLHIYRPFNISPKFDWISFRDLLKIGFPLFVVSYTISFIDTIPRVYIIKYGNEELMGLYAPVFLLLSTAGLFPNVLSSYIYPKFSYKIGSDNNRHALWKALLKLYVFSFCALFIFALIGYFSLDIFVYLFPKYSASKSYLGTAVFIIPFLMFKLGNTLSAVYKSYITLVFYAIFYFIIQTGSIIALTRVFDDVLIVAIYSQLITTSLMLVYSILMNKYLSNKEEKICNVKF